MNNFDGNKKKEWKKPEVIDLDASDKTEGKPNITDTEGSMYSGIAS